MSQEFMLVKKLLEDKNMTLTLFSQAITKEFKKWSAKVVVKVLLEIFDEYDVWLLGYTIFPAIDELLIKDEKLHEELLNLLTKPTSGIKEEFGFLLISFLFNKSYIQKYSINRMFDKLHVIAMNENLPINIRAKAIRKLGRDRSSRTIKLLTGAIKSEDQTLVNSAAHVLSQWYDEKKMKRRVPPQIFSDMISYAKKYPNETLESYAIMKIIAKIGNLSASSTLTFLSKKAIKPEQRSLLLRVAGHKMNGHLLSENIQKIDVKTNFEGNSALKVLLMEHPSCFDVLFKIGHYAEYLKGIYVIRDVKRKQLRQIKKLIKSNKPKVVNYAQQLVRVMPSKSRKKLYKAGVNIGKPNPQDLIRCKTIKDIFDLVLGKRRIKKVFSTLTYKKLPQKNFGIFREEEIIPKVFHLLEPQNNGKERGIVEMVKVFPDGLGPRLAIPPNITYGTLESGKVFANRGDAIYKDISYFSIANHWHAGMYLGFFGHWLKGIHCVSDGIKHLYGDSPNLFLPTKNVKDELTIMFDQIKKDFGVTSEDKYRGRRSPSNLDGSKRNLIAWTAETFYGKDIDWCWNDMIDKRGDKWAGTVNDIYQTRCDGVVEFSYEKNDVKVCVGKRSSRWNITKKGGLKSHDDFHNNDWNKGELCPKVQAGDRGSDTTFKDDPVPIPEIKSFLVTPMLDLDLYPSISLDVNAPFSSNIYVRVTVSKDNGPFYTVIADDLIINGILSNGTRVGPMNSGMELNKEDVVFWMGRTANGPANGPDYWGEEGVYEFRLVVIDEGGNVSPMVFYKRTNLNWKVYGNDTRPTNLWSLSGWGYP